MNEYKTCPEGHCLSKKTVPFEETEDVDKGYKSKRTDKIEDNAKVDGEV